MDKATKLSELYNVLKPEGLDLETMENFYYPKTMVIRTSDEHYSPILEISEELKRSDSYKSFLFMGHRGCGKSTELAELAKNLEIDGFKVEIIKTGFEIDIQNAVYWDLLILVSKKIISIANELNCEIERKLLEELLSFWNEIEMEYTESEDYENEEGLGAEVNLLLGVLNFFVKGTSSIKHADQKRTIIRTKVQQKASEWIEIIKTISSSITEKLNGKRPIIIFEDLDKLDEDIAWKIFGKYSDALSSIPANVIYTFPISLSYSPHFGSVSPYFNSQRLPMIKVHTIDGSRFDAGIKVMKDIVHKRANENLFKEDALQQAIIFTGGCIRDLFSILSKSSSRASVRKSEIIELEDVAYFLKKLQSELAMRIERRHYEFLKNIYQGNKRQIENKGMLLELMQAQVIMEYNGECWHDLHPLIAKFLEDQHLV